MHAVEKLKQVRAVWLNRVSGHLAQGEMVRENFLGQLNRFFDLLVLSIEKNDPTQIETLLMEWVDAPTGTDVNQLQSSLSPILSSIFVLTHDIACAELTAPEALEVVGAVLPIYAHSLEYVSAQEMQRQVGHTLKELDQATGALSRLEKSKSDFISIAAHELKTPLTLIEGYASMLNEMLPKGDNGVQAGVYLKGIEGGTQRLHEIVDDMIDVSIIDNNLLALNYQPVWLNQTLSFVKRELLDTIVQRRQNLVIKPFPGSDEMIFADAERLYQAFQNVITNAIKYTPDGGSITVDGRLLPGFIETIITDTGIGIDPEDHIHIFEKFGRLGSVSLHSSGKTKFKGGGPGLGLSITKGIIEAHGGSIWVESDGYDELKFPGSTFHVLLPIRKSPPDAKTAKVFHSLIENQA